MERLARADSWDGCQIYESFDVLELDIARLEEALLALISAHDAMRARLDADGTVRTLAAAPPGWRIPVTDLASARDPAAVIASLRDELVGRAFPLGRWPAFDVRVTAGVGTPTVHCAFDVALFDAPSVHWLCRELLRGYADPSLWSPSPSEPAASNRQPLTAEQREASNAHWRERTASLPAGPELARRDAADAVAGAHRIRVEARLPGWRRLVSYAAEHGVTPDALLLAAFTEVLAEEAGQREFAVAVVRWSEADDVLRPGEHTRMSWVQPGPPGGSLLATAALYQDELTADLAADGVEALGAMRRHALRRNADSAYAHPVVYSSVVELTGQPLPVGVRPGRWMSCTPGVTVDCIATAEEDELFVCWDAVAAAFPSGGLAGAFHRYAHMVRSLTSPTSIALPQSLTGEQRAIVYGWNETARDLPPHRPVHAAFEDRVRECPDAAAVRCAAGVTSYGQLNAAANGVAWRLLELGAGPGTTVAITTRRSPAMIAATLGVLKAGAAYVPIEPELPGERARAMLERTAAAIVLTTTDTTRWAAPAGATVIEIDREPASDRSRRSADDPPHVAEPHSTAYVIFTSGSTGAPKGVAVAHRALGNLLAWCQRRFDLGAGDIGLAVTSLGFDLSVFDIFGVLGCGGTLYVADEQQRRDPALLLDLLLCEGITFWNSAPTTLAQLAPLLGEAKGDPAERALRLVFLSGDYTPLSLPDSIRAAFARAQVVNLGGATEATVWSNAFAVGAVNPEWRSIPYGRPIDNARYYILDAGLKPCAPGVKGELYIAGECLSKGYVGEPGLTAARFPSDPFSLQPGERMYRTGDHASYLPQGTITLLGRDDGQVKIRGFRVELGEIEHCLRRHPGIRDAVVLARPADALDRRLVAYVVAAGPGRLSSVELREHAGRTLPIHMVPNVVCFLDEFPATPNGKLDRDALPWPVASHEPVAAKMPVASEGPAAAAAPAGRGADDLCAEIAGLFADLLELDAVDPVQDIWDLGATSFTLVQVSNVLKQRYGQRIPVAAVLADPTIDGVARHLAGTLGIDREIAGVVRDVPADVDYFSVQERDKFKAERWNVRPQATPDRVVMLERSTPDDELLRGRATRRDFLDGPVSASAVGRLLSILGQALVDGRPRYGYPSAGDTYAVQVYLHVKPGGVAGIAAGTYYHRSDAHVLERLSDAAGIDRSIHFVSNRPLFDAAAFELYLVGQTHAIEPLYREGGARYLAIEAGHMGQLLMLAQAELGLGLCAIGELAFDRLRPELDLDEGHRFLLGFVGGAVKQRSGHGLLADRTPGRDVEVAIVGLSGRYPGAEDLDALWRNLRSGVRSIGPPPSRRGRLATATLEGGFLDSVDEFDSLLFEIAPVEARTLDPQLRLLLQAVWGCLEHAGHTAASLGRGARRVGVFVATMWHDYELVGAEAARGGGGVGAAATASDIPNRISHFFDLTGPSVAVDTSCSSSLTALHLAVESLRRGECDAAVVAACNVLAHPYHADLLATWGLTASAAGAPGWLPGEGVGALLLRPATTAVAQSDTIHAIVEGTWTGHSGRAGRFGVPDVGALSGSISAALAGAGLTPAQIDYVECALAGATVADAAEIEALASVFGDDVRAEKLAIGTLKHNIGHLEAASGLSQLTKVILQLCHGEIAPTPVSMGNPLLEARRLPVRLVDRVETWDAAQPRRALVNAVGAAGSYGHAVLRGASESRPSPDVPGPHAVVLSAATAEQLAACATRLREYLDATAAEELTLAQIAHTLQTGRVHHEHRLAIWCRDRAALAAALAAHLAGRPHAAVQTAVVAGARGPGDMADSGDQRAGLAGWLAGQEIDWAACWQVMPRRVALPGYPFARDSHWIDAALTSTAEGTADVVDRLRALYAEISGIPVERLDPHVALVRYGLSSALIAQLNVALERDFGVVSRTLLFEHRTLAELAAHLDADRPTRPHPSTAAVPRHGAGTRRDDIAIIGISGRYPAAANLDEFWHLLEAGRDCVGPLPAERRLPGWPADLMVGAFLDGVDRFDALLFGIAPRDADLMDPQERLFLETVWELLDDAGYPRERLRESHRGRVGVFAATMYNDYPFFGVEQSLSGTPVSTGSSTAGIANRVSHFLDLCGPSMTVDTMCSASLTSIHLAISSLSLRECELAIAGGVNLSLHPNKFIEQARLGMTSSDHRCRAFGAGGDGFAPGEGVGAVLLKPLRAANAAGDRIHAIIKASVVNHGGRTNGYTVPNPVAQGALVAQALQEADVDPATIGYVEAHGTGTALGDPVEINGLERAFASAGLPPGCCGIGSVKSNLGHLEGAAGIAGLTKVVLQLRHRRLVPSLHAAQLNPNIDWVTSPFRVQQEGADWLAPAGALRRACVSSFGAGGANAHLVVEEHRAAAVGPPGVRPQLFVISARDDDRLRAMAERLAAALEDGLLGRPDEIAYTLQAGREPLRERLAIVATDINELSELLMSFVRGEEGTFSRGRLLGAPEQPVAAAPVQLDRAGLAEAGERWVRGESLRWELLHPKGAPLMVGLPSYPFAGRRHWLAAVDDEQPRDREEPEPRAQLPLLAKVWRPVATPASPASGLSFICLFEAGSEDVARTLAATNPGVALLRAGEDFGDATGATRAVRDLLARDPAIEGCIDLCDLHRADPRPHLEQARLRILEELLARGRPQRALLAVQGLLDLPDPEPNLAGALMAGLLRALDAERARLLVTVVDVDGSGDIAAQLLTEWAASDRVVEVCYSGDRRFAPLLEPLAVEPGVPVLDPGKVYLVTGATGGIGAAVAGHLLSRGARRLALLGRRPVRARSEWGAGDVTTHERSIIAQVHELERRGAQVALHTGALTDRERLNSFLVDVRATLGEIDGVIHCAGSMAAVGAFSGKDLSAVNAVLEPKVEGLTSLVELCERDRPAFIVLFSSLAAVVPRLAAGVVEYAAANAFVDLTASYLARRGRAEVCSIAWPPWAGIGMRAPIGVDVGVRPLSVHEGLLILDAVIAGPVPANVIVAAPSSAPLDLERLLSGQAPTPLIGSGVSHGLVARSESPELVPRWLTQVFCGTVGISVEELDPALPFGELGIDSILIADLVKQIETHLGEPVEPSSLIDHPTLERLARHLGTRAPDAPATAPRPTGSPRRDQRDADRVAVVGLACRLPGAPDADALWANLRAGHCAIGEVPQSRWDIAALYDPVPAAGRSVSRWGGFIDGIEDFDPEFFAMSAEEATCLDPAIRLVLEATATAIADAGYADHELDGRDVAVFAGARLSDYRHRLGIRTGSAGFGADQNFIAARAAQQYNLTGPNMVVDSACSSALVAVQLAVRSLLAGESELAFAGGVEVLLDERPYLEFSAVQALSPSGRCRTFDQRADGFVPGEGCGLLILKRLDRALEDGDRIRAVIDAVAVGNDGRTIGLTTPNPVAQAAVVRRALRDSRRRADEIGMVEAHGTATMIGDPIELRALSNVFRETTDRRSFCAIGSVKSNIGHLLSAAGIAGLLKAILSVEHGEIPPTLFCDVPNPRFDFAAAPFFPNLQLLPWPADTLTRVAGVSAFGLGGTNAHVIVSAPQPGWATANRRRPLAPPIFDRRRLWLERDGEPAAPAPTRELVSSLLELTFDSEPAPAGGSRA